jgi:hypothetical protein
VPVPHHDLRHFAARLLSLLLAAVVAFACVVTAAHGFGAEPDAERAEVHVDAVGALGLVELDEEQETSPPSSGVGLPVAHLMSVDGAAGPGTVGPSRGHPTTLQRPPSAA